MPEIDIEELRRAVGTFAEPAAPVQSAQERQPGLVGLYADDPARRAALNDCAKLLTGGKAYTEAELRRKLELKEHEPDVIDAAIERCVADRLVDDAAYARSFVESRTRRGHGARKIRQDLARRGIDGEIVESLLAELRMSGSSVDAAIDTARKRFARIDLADQKARAKALRFLLGRGFSSSEADAAIHTVRAEQSAATGGA